MKKLCLALALGAMISIPAMAQNAPDLEFTAGGETGWLPLTQQSDGTWSAAPGSQVTLNNGVTFTLNSITVNTDPFVFYSFSVQNNSSSPMSYTASIPAVPVSLAPGSYTVSSSLGITLTDGNPGSGVSIKPVTLGGSIQQGLVGSNDAGVDLGAAEIDNNSFLSTSTTNYSGGPLSYNLTSPASSISITESFILSPGASVGLSGAFDVETAGAAPEPSSAGLGLLALGAFAGLVVRTRRVRA